MITHSCSCLEKSIDGGDWRATVTRSRSVGHNDHIHTCTGLSLLQFLQETLPLCHSAVSEKWMQGLIRISPSTSLPVKLDQKLWLVPKVTTRHSTSPHPSQTAGFTLRQRHSLHFSVNPSGKEQT